MSVVVEKIVVAFHPEVLLEVFGNANDAIAFSWIQKEGNFLEVRSLFEMDDILDAINQLRQKRYPSLEWLDVLVISWYFQRKDEVGLLVMHFLLNKMIEVES